MNLGDSGGMTAGVGGVAAFTAAGAWGVMVVVRRRRGG